MMFFAYLNQILKLEDQDAPLLNQMAAYRALQVFLYI